ncbi:hypothetical protein BsWGS_26365 [Bradybaena similaris]
MKLTGHALTEDAVDRCNHSWGVVLLLTISASTWLLPQLSYFQQATGKDVAMNRYRANCWCPSQFTISHIAYTQTACAAAFSRALSGVDEFSNKTTTTVRIYSTVSQEKKIFRPNFADETGKPNHNSQPAMTRIYSRIPVVTFVLAVCLLLPYIIWALLSSFSEAGLSQVLRSLKDAQCAGAEVRNEEIIQAISSRHTRSSSTVMYLFFKLLTIAVPIAGLCYVKSELVSASPMLDYSNTMLFCDIVIIQMANVYGYEFQCIFTAENDSMFPRLYDSLHIILAFFLALLVTVNIANLIGWVIKLSPGPFRNGTFSNNKLALDDYLLLYMARQNVGFLTARNLERGLSSEFLAGRNLTFSGETETGHELRPLTC